MTAATLTRALDAKRLANATARTALWGGVLTVIDGDDGRPLLIVSRWALTKALSTLDEVDAFLDKVGA
jgi:hypothetical protein